MTILIKSVAIFVLHNITLNENKTKKIEKVLYSEFTIGMNVAHGRGTCRRTWRNGLCKVDTCM